MKFRLIVSALVVAVLLALAVALDDSSTPTTQSAPAQNADDKALKGLSIN